VWIGLGIDLALCEETTFVFSISLL
jgi:hypothetical protein